MSAAKKAGRAEGQAEGDKWYQLDVFRLQKVTTQFEPAASTSRLIHGLLYAPSSQLLSSVVNCRSLRAMMPVLPHAARRSTMPSGDRCLTGCALAISAIFWARRLLPVLPAAPTAGFLAAAAVPLEGGAAPCKPGSQQSK